MLLVSKINPFAAVGQERTTWLPETVICSAGAATDVTSSLNCAATVWTLFNVIVPQSAVVSTNPAAASPMAEVATSVKVEVLRIRDESGTCLPRSRASGTKEDLLR